ncbi:hypothetical protein, partial [Rhodonellum psychrophilum]|uniref:hypothetical protein n=1 Tax=Rhodonellum psychrophilum TaxID=336828 RepID=UPI001B7FAAD4
YFFPFFFCTGKQAQDKYTDKSKFHIIHVYFNLNNRGAVRTPSQQHPLKIKASLLYHYLR